MPPNPQKKTAAMVLGGVLIAVTPSLLGYMQNRDEIKAKYAQSQTNASSSYDALAASVKELQAATKEQHDYSVKLQAQLEMMEKYVSDLDAELAAAPPPAGSHVPRAIKHTPHVSMIKPPEPKLDKPPRDYDAAVKAFAPE